MNQPTKEEIQRFIEVYSELERFEAFQRLIRKHGAMDPALYPIAEVVTVMEWLKELAK